MLVDGSMFKQMWDAVRMDKHASEDRNILVFVANSDVDAICAVKQLQVRAREVQSCWPGLGLSCSCP